MHQRFHIMAILVLLTTASVNAQSFIHPGLLHSQEDINRMKNAVKNKLQPIYEGFEAFAANPASQSTYKMQGPLKMVGRNPTVAQGIYDSDANAAHQNALMWCLTGDTANANKAKELINAWSSTLQSITGRDAVLMAGLGPFKMVLAAELLRYSNAGWSDADIKQTEKHFKEVIYPVIKDFAAFANGNWDAAAMKTVMSIGIFCNDREIFESALRYYTNGWGNGRLTNYIINEDGQCQESGRDQGHAQLGIGMLAECSEMAWHQGLNLYAYENNRLLKGFEYAAKFNLGNDVPFTPTIDRTGKYSHKIVAQDQRGNLRPLYEQVYNHYVKRVALTAPYTQLAAEKLRPEGPGRPGADHPGYGTLFYTRPAMTPGEKIMKTKPEPPAAINAIGSYSAVNLTWVESIGAASYRVKRASQSGGPYTVIAKNLKQPAYTDHTVQKSVIYYYTVSAINDIGESKNAYETTVAAGLPKPWKQQDIGSVKQKGSTNYNGSEDRLEAGGMGIDSVNDQLQFAYTSLNEEGEVMARFVPQPSSQFSKFGVSVRQGLSNQAAHVSLLIYPGKSGQIEAPQWHVRLLIRVKGGKQTEVSAIGPPLTEPAVTWGRVTGYVWLKLTRKGNSFTGFTSYDGKTWIAIGTAMVNMQPDVLAGLSLSSGIETVSATARFDHVSVTSTYY